MHIRTLVFATLALMGAALFGPLAMASAPSAPLDTNWSLAHASGPFDLFATPTAPHMAGVEMATLDVLTVAGCTTIHYDDPKPEPTPDPAPQPDPAPGGICSMILGGEPLGLVPK